MQREGGGKFEKGRAQGQPCRLLQPFRQRSDAILRDRIIVHTDAFAEIHEVGRRIEPHPVAGSPKDGRRHRRRGSLPVRSADMERVIPLLRSAQSRQQPGDGLKAQLDPVLLETVQEPERRGI